ncbi:MULTISPECIES: EsaB/YukD family protein [unclassified Enterococcus]|uniref:EsaB/YukD family protein n=1 Tax=unclassified Enterococcus TaxID=2608891 RepID=UPI002B4BDE38|nr:EsaB/YukD family protein [Enterococcus sp. CWB-B31]
MSNEHINITLSYSNNEKAGVDLRIPVTSSVYSLIREVNEIFNKDILLKKYQLKVLNKGILLGEEDRLKDYSLTDGDRIEILENEAYERND